MHALVELLPYPWEAANAEASNRMHATAPPFAFGYTRSVCRDDNNLQAGLSAVLAKFVGSAVKRAWPVAINMAWADDAGKPGAELFYRLAVLFRNRCAVGTSVRFLMLLRRSSCSVKQVRPLELT